MRAIKLERLDHFGIEVTDLARAEKFFTSVLGLSAVARMGDQVLLDCGGQNLALFQVSRAEPDESERRAKISNPLGRGHHAFRVSRADFDRAQESLSECGAACARPIDWGDHDCLYFLDPDGNLLELVSYR